MGGRAVVPTIPCTSLMSKVHEENSSLESFIGALRHCVRWGEYRLGDEKLVQDLQEQKKHIDQIFKLLEVED